MTSDTMFRNKVMAFSIMLSNMAVPTASPITPSFIFYLWFYLFTNRTLNVWNSLPNHVVLSDKVNTFKSKLDKSDFKAKIQGTGSRSWY